MIVEFFCVTLEKEMAAHSSFSAWEIPWTEEPGRLQSMGSQRVGHNLAMKPPPPPFHVNINNICLWKIFFKTKILWEKWHCFPLKNIFHVWLDPICFCINLLGFAILVEICGENLASSKYVDRKGRNFS